MPDDNSKAIEAALHEDDELEAQEDEKLTPEQKQAILEEAIAEEEFVADQEDTVNPMLFKGEELPIREEEEEKSEEPENKTPEGTIGSGNLEVVIDEGPISNEEELRKESVNDDNNLNPNPTQDDMMGDFSDPIDETQVTDSSFGTEDTASAETSAEEGGVTADSFGDAMLNNDPVSAMNDEVFAEETPTMEETPVEEAPVEEVPVEVTSVAEAPVETPVEAPAEEVATEIAPAETTADTPAMPEMPAADAPLETAPVEEMSSVADAGTIAGVAAATSTTPTPIPGGMPSSSTEAPVADTTAAAAPKKKGKAGLIIGILVFLLLIGGGIAAFFLYKAHEAPEKQVSDAIDNVFNAPIVGTVAKSVKLASGNVPVWSMTMTESYLNNRPVNASIAFKSEEELYLKVSGITDIINDEIKESEPDEDELTMYNLVVDNVVKPVDNKWIKITAEGLGEDYECLTETGYKLVSADFREKAKELYDAKPFITYRKDSEIEERDGVKYYVIDIDEEASDEFGKKINETEEVKALSTCTTSVIYKLLGFDQMTDDDEDDDYDWGFDWDDDDDSLDLDWDISFDDDDDIYEEEGYEPSKDDVVDDEDWELISQKTTTYKLGIKPMSHELVSIEYVVENDKGEKESVANFSFGVDLNGSELDSAKTPEELVKDITEGLKKSIAAAAEENMESLCTEAIKSGEYNGTQSKCMEEIKKELDKNFDDMNIIELLNEML